MPNNLSVTPLSRESRKENIMKTVSKGAAVLLVIICAVFVCAAQDKLRRVEQPAKFVYPNTPIQVAVSMDGKQLPDREVQAGPDWLRRISLEVGNISGKDINWLLINLMLREPKYGVSKPTPEETGIVITFELPYSGPNVKVLLAGDRITLKPPVSAVDYWTKYAREQGMEDIEKVILDIRQVRFTDDTGWYLGQRTRKDPESGRRVFVTDNPEPPDLHLPTSILIPDALASFF